MVSIRLRYQRVSTQFIPKKKQKVAAATAVTTYDNFLNGCQIFLTLSIKRWGLCSFHLNLELVTTLLVTNKMWQRLPRMAETEMQLSPCSLGSSCWWPEPSHISSVTARELPQTSLGRKTTGEALRRPEETKMPSQPPAVPAPATL